MSVRNKVHSSKRRKIALLVTLTVAIIITACLTILPGPGSELSSFYSNWTINISALVATGLSCLTTIRAYRTCKITKVGSSLDDVAEFESSHDFPLKQYSIDKETGRFHFYTCLLLTIGLVLWTSAEAGWTYYQLGLGIENPFPSIADGFWLLGYVGVILFAFRMNKALWKRDFYDRESIILISISAGLSLGYVINLTFGVATILSSARNELGWMVSILYPILDTIILIPCLLILVSISGRRNNSTYSIHWLLLTVSIIIVTIADIGFDYSEVLGLSDVEEWFWDIFYAASYIVMAGALYAYYVMLSRAYIPNIPKKRTIDS